MKTQKRGRMHPRSGFTPDEDCLLIDLVTQFGRDSWVTIASFMEGRNPRQCKDRYNSYLSPTINNSPYTEEEDDLLRKKYEEFGSKWVKISKFFTNRTDISVKCRWAILNRRDMKNRSKNGSLSIIDQPGSINESIPTNRNERSNSNNTSIKSTLNSRSKRSGTKKGPSFTESNEKNNQKITKIAHSSSFNSHESKSIMVTRKRNLKPPSYKDEDDTFEAVNSDNSTNINIDNQSVFPQINPLNALDSSINNISTSLNSINQSESSNSQQIFKSEDTKLESISSLPSIQSTNPINQNQISPNQKVYPNCSTFNYNSLQPQIQISQLQNNSVHNPILNQSLYRNMQLSSSGDQLGHFGKISNPFFYQQNQISPYNTFNNNTLNNHIIQKAASDNTFSKKVELNPISLSNIHTSVSHESGNEKKTGKAPDEFFDWDLNWDLISADVRDDLF